MRSLVSPAVKDEALLKVRKLYLEKEAMDKLLEEDTKRYFTAVEQATGEYLQVGEDQLKDIREFEEPVFAVVRSYNRDLDALAVTAELDLPSVEELKAFIKYNPEMQNLGLGPLVDAKGLKRELWERRGKSVFHEAAEATGKLKAVILSDGGEYRALSRKVNQARNSDAKTRVVDLPGEVKLELVRVPKGTFWMSADDKNAQKQVEIEHDFYIGKYEVTQEQWQVVMESNPSYFSRTGEGKDQVKNISDAELKRFPVENVSWEDCQTFLNNLNEIRHESGWVYRLPTEAEWEYSCRGGLTSKEDCSFHFYFKNPTNDLSSKQANFDGDNPFGDAAKGKDLGRPTSVGSYEANALGLHDMHGNVWEWCNDWETEGSRRVYRGGGWNYSAGGCRAGYRNGSDPTGSYDSLGLRLALVPSGK